jgi:RNA polymerase sigma-70 factor (ECF subfamily)
VALKVSKPPGHDPDVSELAIPLPAAHAAPAEARVALFFPSVYEAWFHSVERWLRALGIHESEREDVAQEVFLVVRRKLDGFDGRNLPAWLYRIAAGTAANHRRRAWYRRVFLRPRDVDLDAVASQRKNPAEQLEQQQERAALHRLLEKMSEKRRVAFVMSEIDGMSGEEIAAVLDIPVATVWTRLHHARKDFLALVDEHRAKEKE